MKIQNYGSNQTLVNRDDGVAILISYATPVAAYVPGVGYVRTDRKWSVTTSKHINQWLSGISKDRIVLQPQSYLDALLKG